MPAPWPSTGFSPKASIATRQKSWRPAPESSAKCCSGLFGELDVGAGELVPGAAADRDRGADRQQRRRQRDPLSTRGLRETASARPVSAPSRRSTRRSAGEEQQREGDAGEQDQQHRDALVDRGLVGEVVGEAVARLHREHRRQRPERPDRQRRQQPEPVAGEGDQAAAGDQQRQQAAARVGEVEGEQDRRAARRPRASAAPSRRRAGSSRAAARRRSRTSPRWRSSSRAGSSSRGPLPSESATSKTWGRRRLPSAEQRRPTPAAIARPSAKRWRLSSVWAIRNAARKNPR